MTTNNAWWFVLPLLAFGCAHSGGGTAQATKAGGKAELIDEGPASAQGGANAPAAGATASAAPGQLVPFQSAGGFMVLMPPNPQLTDRNEETAGGTVHVHVAQAAEPTGKPSYVATYTEFPPGTLGKLKPKDLLDSVQNSTAQSVSGRVTDSRDIQVAGLPGREFTARTADGNVTARVLVGVEKERMYTLAGTYGEGPPPESVQRFLGSFSPGPSAGVGGSGTSTVPQVGSGAGSPVADPSGSATRR